uniref:Uncharacterized protein n=1 Tax=Rhizophora mucronata TaxID=61149 RepID=A0A2P2PJN6_RHIMU
MRELVRFAAKGQPVYRDRAGFFGFASCAAERFFVKQQVARSCPKIPQACEGGK